MALTKPGIARVRSLQEKKNREEAGLFVVEGEKVVGELMAVKYPFAEVYATEEWIARNPAYRPEPLPRPGTQRIVSVTADEMARLSHYPTPSPLLAVGRTTRPQLANGAVNRGFTLALDGIQDPGNVGTLLRVADWFAFERVLLSPDCADLFSQKVVNASMGSFARVTVHTGPLETLLAGVTVPVLGCDLAGDDVHTLKPAHAAVVVIGSEGRGLSSGVQTLVTRRITIPKFGRAESLNAAVAAAIVCDNLRRLTAGR